MFSSVVYAPSIGLIIWMGCCVLDVHGLNHGLHLLELGDNLMLVVLHWIWNMVHLWILINDGSFNFQWFLLKYLLELLHQIAHHIRIVRARILNGEICSFLWFIICCLEKQFESHSRLLNCWYEIQFANGLWEISSPVYDDISYVDGLMLGVWQQTLGVLQQQVSTYNRWSNLTCPCFWLVGHNCLGGALGHLPKYHLLNMWLGCGFHRDRFSLMWWWSVGWGIYMPQLLQEEVTQLRCARCACWNLFERWCDQEW